jgi:hypothetical protein
VTEVADAKEAMVEGRGFLALRGLEEDEEPMAAFEAADFTAEARRGRGLVGAWGYRESLSSEKPIEETRG